VLRKDKYKVLHLSKAGFKNKLAKCVAAEWCPEILDEDGRQNMDTWALGYCTQIFYGDEDLVKEVYNNVPEGKPKHKTFEDFDNFLHFELFAKQHDELCDQHARAHYYNFPEEHPGHLNGLRNHPNENRNENSVENDATNIAMNFIKLARYLKEAGEGEMVDKGIAQLVEQYSNNEKSSNE
jgi:hypothetical protein